MDPLRKMPVNVQDFIDLLAQLLEEKKLRGAVSGCFKGGLITGLSAAFGGLFMGPIGLAVGGVIGGVLSARYAQNDFQSISVILKNMSSEQKQKLYERVKHAFKDFGPQDVVALSMLVLSRKSFTELALREAISFLTNDMSIKVQ